MKLKLKFYGDCEAVDAFKRHLDDNFLAIVSETKNSDKGGCHAFATIEVVVE